MQVDVTLLGYFMALVSLYYVALFVLSLRVFARRDPEHVDRPPVVILVPAHDEELVIGDTLASLTALEYPQYCVLVLNDGSKDRTSERATAFETTGKVLVVDRPPEVGGFGKGSVLNDGFRVVHELVEQGHPLVAGFDPQEIVIGVVDADGTLERDSLSEVARLFHDPRVGGVQLGVIIGNAEEGLIARCQDLEFVGFSHLAQAARDRIGSVGLGGNGQFTRLRALRALGRPPWTSCLTEDLDLGLHLTRLGWKIRFCRSRSVTQQGVRTLRAWIRQRTRWAQGHYQCWDHVPRLLTAGNVPLITRLDLVLYLLFVAFVMFVAANLAVAFLGALGVVTIVNEFLAFVPAGPARNATTLAIGLGPVFMLLARYQQHSPHPLRWWELPAYGAAFGIYVYLWALASVLAWFRLTVGRTSWAKTRRIAREGSAR